MNQIRWVNQSHPQTLYIGVVLLYIDAFFSVINGGLASGLGFLLAVGYVASGVGIANDRRWAWRLGVGISSIMPLFFVVYIVRNGLGVLFDVDTLISMVFPVAQLASLVHPRSRSHVKMWFA